MLCDREAASLMAKNNLITTANSCTDMRLQPVVRSARNSSQTAQSLFNEGASSVLRWHFDESGVRVLDRDWDTLLILDCARYDYFSEVVELSGSLTREKSVASVTANFVTRNFRDRRAHDVVYLSANPAVGSREDDLDIHKLVGVWHDQESEKRGQENKRGLTDPKPVVEKSLELHEEYPNKRHIVHFLPPHVPHIYKDGEEIATDSPYRNYEAAREGQVTASAMREVYVENLEFVVDAIQRLLDKITGKVVITSDHGELLGEGMPRWMKFLHDRYQSTDWHKYDFGHYSNIDLPELVDVPWFEVPFSSRRETISEQPVTNEYDTESIEDTLKALGYR